MVEKTKFVRKSKQITALNNDTLKPNIGVLNINEYLYCLDSLAEATQQHSVHVRVVVAAIDVSEWSSA